jgi:hypothetical protein
MVNLVQHEFLRQKVEYKSQPVAMLGLNLSGADDPVGEQVGSCGTKTVLQLHLGSGIRPVGFDTLDSTGWNIAFFWRFAL